MNATLIVLAYHGDRWVPGCIEGLDAAQRERSHLVLVDNSGNSCIGSLDLQAFRAEVLRTQEPLGYARANNFALVNAGRLGEYVGFLNQDTLTRGPWLDASIACMESDARVAAVTPVIRTYDWQGLDPNFGECLKGSPDLEAGLNSHGELQPFHEVPAIPGAAMVVRRSALEEVGPFDPVYGSYYEDYDLCLRLRQAGYKVGVCTSESVAHFSGSASSSAAAERRRARWVTRNRVIMRQRATAGRVASLLSYFVQTFPRGLARSLMRRPAAKPLTPFVQAHWDLMLMVPRLVSDRHDRECWRRYLQDIGWPPLGSAASVQP